jgi:hypothetical protein
MHQGNTQTCYAAAVCTLGARLSLHRCLQPEPASFESQQLHLAIISAFAAMTDRSQARPSPEDIVRRLNSCLDPAGRYKRFNIMRQHCAGEFLHDFIGKGSHHETILPDLVTKPNFQDFFLIPEFVPTFEKTPKIQFPIGRALASSLV